MNNEKSNARAMEMLSNNKSIDMKKDSFKITFNPDGSLNIQVLLNLKLSILDVSDDCYPDFEIKLNKLEIDYNFINNCKILQLLGKILLLSSLNYKKGSKIRILKDINTIPANINGINIENCNYFYFTLEEAWFEGETLLLLSIYDKNFNNCERKEIGSILFSFFGTDFSDTINYLQYKFSCVTSINLILSYFDLDTEGISKNVSINNIQIKFI